MQQCSQYKLNANAQQQHANKKKMECELTHSEFTQDRHQTDLNTQCQLHKATWTKNGKKRKITKNDILCNSLCVRTVGERRRKRSQKLILLLFKDFQFGVLTDRFNLLLNFFYDEHIFSGAWSASSVLAFCCCCRGAYGMATIQMNKNKTYPLLSVKASIRPEVHLI